MGTNTTSRWNGPAKIIPVRKRGVAPAWAKYEVRAILFSGISCVSKHVGWFRTEQEAECYARKIMFGHKNEYEEYEHED